MKDRWFDGLIITGAPVEQMPFEQVEYWPELCRIMEWSRTHVHSTFHICWGAQAALYYHYGINKTDLPEKLFGVYPHRVERRSSMLMRGFDDVFMVPHSRHTTVRREDIERCSKLKILASSEQAGVYAMATEGGRQIFITGHSEYDARTLEAEYLRDKMRGCPSTCRKTITRTMTTRSRPWSRGAATRIFFTRTGSTTSSTRPRPMTCRPSGPFNLKQKHAVAAAAACFCGHRINSAGSMVSPLA